MRSRVTIREFFGNCQNVHKYAVKVTTSNLNFDLFFGETGEPVPEHILDIEIVRWYLPEYEADLIEIYT